MDEPSIGASSRHRASPLCLLIASVLVATLATLPAGVCQQNLVVRTSAKIGLYQGLHESNLSLVYPVLGLPALLQPGSDLSVRVVLHQEAEGDWEVTINRSGNQACLPVTTSSYTNGSWDLSVLAPDEIAPGLYDLSVSKGELADLEKHAVAIGNFRDRVKLVHLTDVHADRFFEGDPVEQEKILHAIDAVNLIHPDLAVISGDFQDPGSPEKMRLFGEEFLWRLNIPVYLAPGNHEYKVDNLSYTRLLNPYPDYAFDFGPVRFVSLDLYQARAPQGGDAPSATLTTAQLDFLDQELARCQITTVFYHEPGMPVFRRSGSVLGLAGHTHDAEATPAQDGGLLLVTRMAVEGLRVIEFTNDSILTSTFDADDLRTDLSLSDLSIELLESSSAVGRYQSLMIANHLAVEFPDARWTFTMSSKDGGEETLIVGAQLDEEAALKDVSLLTVAFDLDSRSERFVECAQMASETPSSWLALDALLTGEAEELSRLRSILLGAGTDPGRILGGIEEDLAVAVDAAYRNWTRAALGHFRVDSRLGELTEPMAALEAAVHRIGEKALEGLNVSLVDSRLETILADLQGHHFTSALEDLAAVMNLEEQHWMLADEISEAEMILAGAAVSGLDITQQRYRLLSATALFEKGNHERARGELDGLHARWPELFEASEIPGLAVPLLIVIVVASRECLGDDPRGACVMDPDGILDRG